MFSGFYVGQAALLLYLFATFLIAPFFLTGYTVNTGTACFAGSLIILATFLPVLVYFAKDPVRRSSASAVIMCGLVYGTTDFPTARGKGALSEAFQACAFSTLSNAMTTNLFGGVPSNAVILSVRMTYLPPNGARVSWTPIVRQPEPSPKV